MGIHSKGREEQQTMELDEAFRYYREKILARWVEYTLESYESSSFFKREKGF